ncbi:hypothetical protein [Elizabethkingia ursingii]|uniref:Uncharacterized protein n=1 Tax=Elizabethkingia ursingii TaxID=1756150 RepID=A0AAJ3NAQ1_9FLAO|nr:hypothetical protein [Elizabethkingia ursingii]AQX08005.1 hypothetical protein BBD34_04815 [Elizabethkingia ursingii]OPB73641.1 hypothetical protein BAY32_11405 [Elizabethkingia ursingii]
MTKETLTKANYLLKSIKEFNNALNCFEDKYENGAIYDRTAKLVFDVDDLDGGREFIPVPMILSNEIISFLKSEIKKKIAEYEKEFHEL